MDSQDQARRILAAWSAGSVENTPGGRAGLPRDAAEQERNELLEGIREGLSAGGMRGAVSLRLLRHLASARN